MTMQSNCRTGPGRTGQGRKIQHKTKVMVENCMAMQGRVKTERFRQVMALQGRQRTDSARQI